MRIVSRVLAASLSFVNSARADPVGADIAHPGPLTDAGLPASGVYDSQFALFTSAIGESAVDTASVDDLVISGRPINTSLDFAVAFELRR